MQAGDHLHNHRIARPVAASYLVDDGPHPPPVDDVHLRSPFVVELVHVAVAPELRHVAQVAAQVSVQQHLREREREGNGK